MKKLSLPSGPPRAKTTPTKQQLDTSELIRKLKRAYADPVSPPPIPTTVSPHTLTHTLLYSFSNTHTVYFFKTHVLLLRHTHILTLSLLQKATMSSAHESPGALPRFPNSRLRTPKPHLPASIPSSLNSSSDTYPSVSPGTSITSSHLDSSSQSRDHPLTPEPPRSASYLTPGRPRGGAASRFLSRSNPPPAECVGGKQGAAGGGGGGRGGISIPPLRITTNRHSLVSLETAGTAKLGGRTPLLGGGKEEMSLFLPKFDPKSQVVSGPGRPKEVVPSSWRVAGGQRSLENERLKLQNAPLRRRSFTVPSKHTPKSRPGWHALKLNSL